MRELGMLARDMDFFFLLETLEVPKSHMENYRKRLWMQQ